MEIHLTHPIKVRIISRHEAQCSPLHDFDRFDGTIHTQEDSITSSMLNSLDRVVTLTGADLLDGKWRLSIKELETEDMVFNWYPTMLCPEDEKKVNVLLELYKDIS